MQFGNKSCSPKHQASQMMTKFSDYHVL